MQFGPEITRYTQDKVGYKGELWDRTVALSVLFDTDASSTSWAGVTWWGFLCLVMAAGLTQ